MEKNERYTVDYNPEGDCVVLFDNEEQIVFVMTKEQVEKLLDWYCKEFCRMII